MNETYVPDISTIINGRITQLVESGSLKGSKVVIPNVIFSELEYRAGLGKDSGFGGLAELKRLKSFAKNGTVQISFAGDRPPVEDITSNQIRSLVRDIAQEEEATLITSDEVTAEAAEVEGVKVRHLKPIHEDYEPKLFRFFEPDAMSVHLKEDVKPMAKVGRPGNFRIKSLREETLSGSELRDIAREITEFARRDPEGYIEVERKGASMIQLREYRIAIARPPFSDSLEITAVRPIADVSLEDYALSDKLKKRLDKQAEGIMVAGSPGAGKSTFAQALAEFYGDKEKVVKTMETPRDLQVADEVTQYTALEGDMKLTSDILLMVRPDYTIYDELRRSDDFEIFVDMRFAGVGMVGVVHSSEAIDAIQRLIGRVELGMIPMVVDTVIFINEGRVQDVYALRPTVGVPHGMSSPDLARPMVEVQDFETGEACYQIYSFGEQVVVMPVEERELSPEEKGKAQDIKDLIEQRTGAKVDVEMASARSAIVRAASKDVPRIIGRNGRTVEDLQDKLGVRLDIREEKGGISGKTFEPDIVEQDDKLMIKFADKYAGNDAKIFAGGSLIFKGSIGKNGEIQIKKDSQIGKQMKKVKDHGISVEAEIV